MKKTKTYRKKTNKRERNGGFRVFRAVLCLIVISVVAVSAIVPRFSNNDAYADELVNRRNELTRQINEMRQKIADYEAEAKRLSGEAATIAGEIAKLQAEINVLQAQINLSEAEIARLDNEIKETEYKIQNNNDALGLILREIYDAKNVTMIQRLVSSDDLSSFVAKESRLNKVSDELTKTVEEAKTLKATLEIQKTEAQAERDKLAGQRAVIATQRAEQQSLHNVKKSQEREVLSQRNAANSERQRLQQEQDRVNAEIAARNTVVGVVPGDPNKGGYPWASSCPAAKLNGRQWIDPWGMYVCECVSYAAWKVHQNYGNMPNWGGHGNANQWGNNARNAGIPVNRTPKVGSVGFWNSGRYGHVVWVEAVNGNSVLISQYNLRNAATNNLPGQFSQAWYSVNAFDGFIHFGEWRR